MMTLIALAISVSFLFSLAVTLGFPAWTSGGSWRRSSPSWSSATGSRCARSPQAQGALKELAKLLPDTAVRLVDERTEDVSVSDLRDGDVVLVRPGASIPADGVVREGTSEVNESMITGESRPVGKGPAARRSPGR